MNKLRQNSVQLIIVTDLSQTLRSTLEIGAVIAILIAITGLAASDADRHFAKSQIAEALIITSTTRYDIIAYRAEHGEWPKIGADESKPLTDTAKNFGRYVSHLELGAEGKLTAVFDGDRSIEALRGQRLTLRPVVVTANPSAPVSWVCGQHPVGDGRNAGSNDDTTVDPHLLPSICRGH